MRALITGATGYLGTAMLESVPAGVEPVALGHRRGRDPRRVDITDFGGLAEVIDTHRPDTLVHLAAVSRLGDAERRPDRAHLVNVTGSRHVARAAAERGIRLVALSTDNVFDGTAAPYRETDPTTPVGVYGRSKQAAEREIIEAHPRPLIVRISLLVGRDRADRQPFSAFVLRRAAEGEPVGLFEEEHRNFYPVTTAAVAIWEAASHRDLCGLLHLGAKTSASRLQYGRALLEAAGYDPELAQPAVPPPGRPSDLTLDVSLAERTLHTPPPTMEEVVAETIRDVRS